MMLRLSRIHRGAIALLAVTLLAAQVAGQSPPSDQRLPGTELLTIEGDLADVMIAGVDRFLLHELEESIGHRGDFREPDFSSPEAYESSLDSDREWFADLIGVKRNYRVLEDVELVATVSKPALVGRGKGFDVFAVRWPAFDGVHGEGLLLQPTTQPIKANVVVLPDCEQQPELLAGLVREFPPENQIARRLAENGCRVVVPILIDRQTELSRVRDGRPGSTVTHREFLYRAAYQMKRHLIGYEVHKVLALVDWFERIGGQDARIGVVGYGEGGLLALYAGAIDSRIDVVGVSGYFNSRQEIWREPIDRNVFGLLTEFGDAEIASLVAPRALIVEACAAPSLEIAAGGDSAPARLVTPAIKSVRKEVERARELTSRMKSVKPVELVESGDGTGPFFSESFVQRFGKSLADNEVRPVSADRPKKLQTVDEFPRHQRQFREIAEHNEKLISEGTHVRAAFLSEIDRKSGIEAFETSTKPYRDHLWKEVIGRIGAPLEPANPRTRAAYGTDEFDGYEVVLDVYPDVVLYGILLVPKDIKPDERRPVVVCQHGLEGRAEHTVTGDKTSYRDFAARLAQRGFVTFSPQHLYRTGDTFRTLQRKANPLNLSLFSVMVAQHRQLLQWLRGLAFVDPERIAFYGISYGGKSAMRIPAILDEYCLSICSSDFSDWIRRTSSKEIGTGYLAHNEYEIYEFGLGASFNYGDLAALICPRPFMVEEFHESGPVAESNRAEYSRVSLLYENLGIADRTRLSFYPAWDAALPYADRKTFDFLHEHLDWAKPTSDGPQ